MTDQSVKTNGKQHQALTPYGNRDEVKDMEGRILAMLPGADKMSVNERRAVAQIAVAHGLDPFNGEVWGIPGRGALIGVKGLRKHAHKQVKGNYWIEYVEITDPDQRKRWKLAPGDMAFEARLFDTENIETYVSAIERLTKAGIPWESVKNMVGEKPYVTGYGVLGDGENTKMNRVQCARKRAETNAIRQRFDVPFGAGVSDEDTGEVIEGTATEVKSEPPFKDNAAADAAIVEADLQATRQGMFGDPA